MGTGMSIIKIIVMALIMLPVAGCGDGAETSFLIESGKNGKVVLDLCKYVVGLETGSVTIEQIEEFRNSEDRTTRYVAFYEAMTSAGISGDVAMSELARFVFHDKKHDGKKADKTKAAYDYTYAGDVRLLNTACRNIRKTLFKGGVPDAKIVRYLVGFLVASPEDRQKIEKDCPVFVQMYRVVSDAVREIVSEAEDAKIIFTDGGLDEDIHEECKRRRLALAPCSMMGRAFSRETFMEKMTNGVAVAQLGFELFGRNGIQLSHSGVSGFLYRHGRMSDSVRMRGIEFADKLAMRILDLQEKRVVDSLKDEETRSKFLSVQWRIARMARLRAEQERKLGLVEQSEHSLEIADKLDECNHTVRQIRQAMSNVGAALTAKERLQLALRRANFEEAQKPANEILKANPDDSEANFAMGMWHIQHERWSEAERHLLRCLDKRPNEVAVLNNLAIVYLKRERLEEARTYARKAFALMPDSTQVKDTHEQIEKVFKNRK